MARKRQEQEHENLDRWLLTYADLITLLLAFFITMYSMSRVDAKKFGAVQMALQGVLHGGRNVFEGRQPGLPTDEKRQPILTPNGLKLLQEKLGKTVHARSDTTKAGGPKEEANKNLNISTNIDERGLVIHVLENAFFETGKSDLTPVARTALDAIASVIQGINNYIRVEGHTDNVPIHNQDFPSNWELSTERATKVVRYFLDNYAFRPDKISASGYAEYRPLVPNDTAAHRAINRRVDIVILSAKMGGDEPTVLTDTPEGSGQQAGHSPPETPAAQGANPVRPPGP